MPAVATIPIVSSPRISIVDRILEKILLPFIPTTVRPNHVTGFRFVMIPLVLGLILFEQYKLAFWAFSVAAFSDAVDGAMARTRNQITDWGKLYDPLADKLLVGSVAVLLLVDFVSTYLVAAILLVEILLILNAAYQREVRKRVIQAVFAGKMKMILQSAGVMLVFLFAWMGNPILLNIGNITLYASMVFGTISLVVYRSI